ncbi:MAG: pseudoazurin [Pseudomonadota bacterium]
MKPTLMFVAAALGMAASLASAETFDVKMLNKGEAGKMIFEPSFIAAQPGDTVRFLATDKGHNAETVKGMVPEGMEPFKGKMNEEIEVELTTEGVIGVKCKPHLGMGMVMVIRVGDSEIPEDFLDTKMPKRAKKAFESIVAAATTN